MCLSSRHTIVIIVFLHLGFTISGDSSASLYYPLDDIAINCGSSGSSTAIDGREWIGDDVGYTKGRSTTSRALHQYLSADHVPYLTARISRSHFTYTFHVSPGQKFVRLHFYPSSYIGGFKVSKSFFSVKLGPYTLLSNFSASLTAYALGVEFFAKEFCVNVDDDKQALSITFSPSPSSTSSSEDIYYAFINGIEIVSMPTGLYYNRRGDLGAPVVGYHYRFFIDNRTALEAVHRLNIGGKFILPIEDLGMYRSWSEDRNYLSESGAVLVRTNRMIKYSNLRTFIAPMRVYQTAWSRGPNLTWKLPVDLGFRYLVRLHFSMPESEKTESGHRDFVIFINNQIVELDEGVIKWSGPNRFSVYSDYVVTMEGDRMEGKHDLIIALRPKPKLVSGTRHNDAFLNGLEIFKLSNPDNNLAGPNPESIAHDSLTSWTSNLRTLVFVFGGGNLIAASVILVLTVVNIIIYQLNPSDGKRKESPLLKDEVCRRFSLAEIELATNNFDDACVVGNGGFGKVYKGSIGNGARIVAIKRLKLESKQGAIEFWTEIKTLSTFRHIHLVSLIGYCDEGHEMLLVYEYMAHGALADHLYKVRNRDGNSSLSWERRLRICIGAARGIDYLHTGRDGGHRLIHRDVKSSNILLDENWVAKISDFGLSKMDTTTLSQTHISTDIKGTFGYFDPEYFVTRRLRRKSDVFAFGVVLFEVLCGRPAVDISLEEEQHSLALWARHCIQEGKLDQIVDPSVREQISIQCFDAFAEIANKCLHKSPNERPTMAEVITSLEFVLELQGCADFGAEEENIEIGEASNEHISCTSFAETVDKCLHNTPNKQPTMAEVVTSPEFAFELQGCADFDTKEENIEIGGASNEQISWTSSTRDENMNNVEQVIAYGESLSPKGTNLLRMKKTDHASNSGPRCSWKWDSHLGTMTLSKAKTSPIVKGCRQFSLREIEEATDNFTHFRLIREDTYCKVYLGLIDDTIKIVTVQLFTSKVLYEEFFAEAKMLSKLRHTNLVPLVGYCYDKMMILVYDYFARGTLYDHLHSTACNNFLSWKQRLQICIDAARGLNYLHTSTTISHGNVHSRNILLDNDVVAKFLIPVSSGSKKLTQESDVCSFGILLFEVLRGGKVIDREPKEGQYTSYMWIKDCIAPSAIDQIIDPALVGKIVPDCLSLFAYIISKCLPLERSEQPPMLRVLHWLELALELQETFFTLGN